MENEKNKVTVRVQKIKKNYIKQKYRNRQQSSSQSAKSLIPPPTEKAKQKWRNEGDHDLPIKLPL